jgi:hypothetical protein
MNLERAGWVSALLLCLAWTANPPMRALNERSDGVSGDDRRRDDLMGGSEARFG